MPERRAAIPARRTELIGRSGDLRALRDLVLHGDARIVTLSGAAGSGKTMLALETARNVGKALTDGAAFVDLSGVREPETIALSCCATLGLLDRRLDPERVLAAHLAPRQLLLVLDNCEHLVAAVADLVNLLLDACPDLRIVATSRVRLHVPGEALFPVQPLPVPTSEAATPPADLGAIPSVELFVRRATALNARFSLEDNAPAVASICRQLDGLPLAIELAAAQTSALTPAEIAQRLKGRDGVGSTAAGGVPPRRLQTMDATLDWSHDLLDARAQIAFRRLAVFSGGWTLEAAEAVCAYDGDRSTIASTVVALVEHSLVVRDPVEAGGRFRMLAPIAEYAAGRLAASDEATDVAVAHAAYYLSAISGDSPEWREVEPDVLDRIAADYQNCTAAMLFVERARLMPLVIGFNVSLLLFWRIRGLLGTGMRRLRAALDLLPDETTRERGFVLAGLAHFGQLLGDLESAEEHALEAEATFAAVDDVVGRRTVVGFLGDIALDRDDFAGARTHYARARELIESDAAQLDLGFWHANIGRTAAQAGDDETAERELDAALACFRTAPTWYQGHVLVQLGRLARRRGAFDRARRQLVTALGYLQRYGAALEAVACLDELARLALDRHEPARAATLFAAATGVRDARALSLADTAGAARSVDIDATRAALSPETFSAAWAAGLGLSLEEALAVAGSRADATRSTRQRGPGSPLTPREREIANLVAEGMTNRQIADRLVIAPGTVRIHVERILGKLGLTSRVQVATWVVLAPDPPR